MLQAGPAAAAQWRGLDALKVLHLSLAAFAEPLVKEASALARKNRLGGAEAIKGAVSSARDTMDRIVDQAANLGLHDVARAVQSQQRILRDTAREVADNPCVSQTTEFVAVVLDDVMDLLRPRVVSDDVRSLLARAHVRDKRIAKASKAKAAAQGSSAGTGKPPTVSSESTQAKPTKAPAVAYSAEKAKMVTTLSTRPGMQRVGCLCCVYLNGGVDNPAFHRHKARKCSRADEALRKFQSEAPIA